MIYNMVALRGPDRAVFAMLVHEQMPIAVEYLGTEEGDSPKEAYFNWMCRVQKINLGTGKDAVEKLAQYRKELEETIEGLLYDSFTLPRGVLS